MSNCVRIAFILYLAGQWYSVQPLNILGIFPYQGKTHFFVFEHFLRELALRGHNLTVISYFPQRQPLKNYHDIILNGNTNIYENLFQIEKSYWTLVKMTKFLITSGTDNCKILLEDKKVQELWITKRVFDIILVEQFNSDCSLGLAYKLGAPVIGLTSHTVMPWHCDRFGIPRNPSFVPFIFFKGGTKPTLGERLERTIIGFIITNSFKYLSQPEDEKTLAKYFDEVPPLEELGRNMKLFIVYTHPVLFGSSLLPANVIEVNGYHVAKPKPLPTDIEKFIHESEHGVIYISFGSMIQPATVPPSIIESIIAALSELPQRAIWKWDQTSLPGNTKNILLSKWLPQNDILAHPKVVAFYSHCGLLSTTEAVHHGVPLVGMPIFGDQPINAAAIEENGFGVQIDTGEITKENLLNKFKTILDPKFREQVKQRSKAWHDRPISAMDSAVFWTEFTGRHKNYTMKTAAVEVPLYQYYSLDVAFIVFLTVLTCAFFTMFIINGTILKLRSQKDKDQ